MVVVNTNFLWITKKIDFLVEKLENISSSSSFLITQWRMKGSFFNIKKSTHWRHTKYWENERVKIIKMHIIVVNQLQFKDDKNDDENANERWKFAKSQFWWNKKSN